MTQIPISATVDTDGRPLTLVAVRCLTCSKLVWADDMEKGCCPTCKTQLIEGKQE